MMKSSLYKFRMIPAVLLAAGLILFSTKASAQQIGVKTNALMWTALTPNVGCEVVVGQRSSLDLSIFGHYGPYGLESRLFALQPEYRYWFSGRPMTREFVGVSAMVADYDMIIKNHVYDGSAGSLGLIGGYAFSLSRSWRLELCGGVAILGFRQKQYYRHDNYDDYFIEMESPLNSWGYKLFPAKLGVTFTYIIK
jgi:hypothetical protein